MEQLTLNDNTNSDAGISTAPEAEEIRGMMPTFNVWQEAQETLAAGRAAALRPRGGHDEAGTHRRWPWFVAGLVVIALVIGLERAAGQDAVPLTATTPVAKMPWRDVTDPAGAFHVSLPAKPSAHETESVAGAGRELEARIPQTIISIQTYDLNSPNQAHALVDPIIRDRASALGGSVDNVRTIGTAPDQSFEAVVHSATALAKLRVVLNGKTLYLLEFRGDVESQRDGEIYDYVVASFAP